MVTEVFVDAEVVFAPVSDSDSDDDDEDDPDDSQMNQTATMTMAKNNRHTMMRMRGSSRIDEANCRTLCRNENVAAEPGISPDAMAFKYFSTLAKDVPIVALNQYSCLSG